MKAFSVLDLLTVLASRGTTFDLPAIFRRLVGQYVVDLPLTADDIIALAAAHQWLPGPAHTALASRPGGATTGLDWASTWLQIATQARRHTADALTSIIKAAFTGSIEHVRPSFRTRRYRELVVLALVACHEVGQPPPVNLPDHLGDHAALGLGPRPPYVLAGAHRRTQAAIRAGRRGSGTSAAPRCRLALAADRRDQ